LPLIPAKRAKTLTKAELAIKRRKSSANRELALLKAALNLAVEKRKIPVDHTPWAQVELFKGGKGQRIRFLSVPEQLRLVNACSEDFRHLVRGALYTGARYA
jgi:integrase